MLLCPILFTLRAAANAASTPIVVLHLKGGDQISGFMVSQSTNEVVISNAWAKVLSIPVSEISSRETKNMPMVSTPNHPVAKSPAARHTRAIVALTPSIKTPAKTKGIWHGQFNVGTTIILNSTDQQDYSGHAKIVYVKHYPSYPKKFFRNTTDFGGEYQRTDRQESANHAHISDKSDFDLWDSFYTYGEAGVGYDRIQNIAFQDQVGPGGGFHLIQRPDFALDAEVGATYRQQYNLDAPNLEAFYARLAEDLSWEICRNIKLTEHIAFYPDFENQGQYHNNLISTLSYGLWKNLVVNLTVVDKYNTQLNAGTNPNEFDFRTSLGYKF